ncbi:MAG: hypothetical protein IT280_03930 [Ignavibacteria bacterium]|nr:hypothetical protein [Ignavibacteria bacterium]
MKVVLISIVLLFSTKIMAQENDMLKLLWIVDKWRLSENDKTIVEQWVIVNDSLYTGSSNTSINGKVIFSETLTIENTNEGIFYSADVSHNPAPVRFKLTNINDNCAVFENPDHDFPKKITYANKNGNLHAFIEGPGNDGTYKIINFYFYKER